MALARVYAMARRRLALVVRLFFMFFLFFFFFFFVFMSVLMLDFFFVFDLGFTALSRIFHLYRADRSSKVGENRRTRRKTT